jgi:hypothetical protein
MLFKLIMAAPSSLLSTYTDKTKKRTLFNSTALATSIVNFNQWASATNTSLLDIA